MSAWVSRYGGRQWRLTPEGLESRSGPGAPDLEVHRTRGEPATMRLYWSAWAEEIRRACQEYSVPLELLLTVIATENGPGFRLEDGSPLVRPARQEPGYISDDRTPHRISVGPCHLLISTARDVMGDPAIDREWLEDIANNLRAAAAYLAQGERVTGTDPILACARYNAGRLADASSPRSRFHNRWHLRAYGDHLDRAANWYGDAVRVMREEAPAVVQVPAGVERASVELEVGGRRFRVTVEGVG